ncbi:RHS repeat-associated core domain-containing protein [Desulfogranum marinum]|uniref:RHS repeat-associated core domain-containing protein n=1 Tax=Desulfogranum marinum TaxID=453220 RepID=UPI001965CA4F|nr:RHS repeat-associated core domain-containing protein [Desulfogranum marinum]MBM9512730.1 RHS repeat protein [Desulfogranum marinum]
MNTLATAKNYCSLLLLAGLQFFVAPPATGSPQPYLFAHQVNFGTGNKYHQERDIALNGPGLSLSFKRTYNSQSTDSALVGYGWSANITEQLVITQETLHLRQANGRMVYFADQGVDTWSTENGQKRIVTRSTDGYELQEPNGYLKKYDNSGKLTSVTDTNKNSLSYSYADGRIDSIATNFGQTLSFTYTEEKLSAVQTPAGKFSYTYDANDNLIIVSKPDGSSIQYLYDDPNDAHNLTGRLDEEGRKNLTVAYDAEDRVVTAALEGGLKAVSIHYSTPWERTVTDSLGNITTYALKALNGEVVIDHFEGPGCSSCGSTADTAYTFNDRLQISTATDANGVSTGYTYDEQGNLLTKTVAQGTLVEHTATQTYTAANKISSISEPSVAKPGEQKTTSFVYDDQHNLTSKTETGYSGLTLISTTTAFSYNNNGQLIAVDGPRNDVNDTISLSYHPNEQTQGNNRGRLHTVTNSLGHTITYDDYTVFGSPTTITDPNGIVTTRTYDINNRLLAVSANGLTTSYTYDSAGNITAIQLPGNRSIAYSYTSSGLLENIIDQSGNSISYAYDSEGQRIGEEIHDPDGVLTKYSEFEYNDAGKLSKTLLPGPAERSADYDIAGNLVETINATGLHTTMEYDPLGRLTRLAEAGKSTGYIYDQDDNLTQFTDPKGHITTFTYDDLGRKTSRIAPDTGIIYYSYDEAGNFISSIDALGRSIEYTYDSSSRLTQRTYEGIFETFIYDTATNGIGRLTTVTDEHGTRTLQYNSSGRLTTDSRSINGTESAISYQWSNETGELNALIYPSGMQVEYNRNNNGQIESISIDGQTIIDAVTHLPFGPLKSATLGSTNLNRNFDQRYNLTSIAAGTMQYTYSRDAEGHVTGIDNISPPTVVPESATYNYGEGTNQINSKTGNAPKAYTHDAVGNIIADGTLDFTFDALNRLTEVKQGENIIAEYGYDTENRRIYKIADGVTTHFHYDINGMLIAETDAAGTPLREYIYLDNEPIALNEYENNPGLYYYLNDHLGTPQQLIAETGSIVWRAKYLPFGKAQVYIELITNNIHFPGQYFDRETGLHYNWHRFYDPKTSRYLTADPIGLLGGIDLYSYVQNNPINYFDPEGLEIGYPDTIADIDLRAGVDGLGGESMLDNLSKGSSLAGYAALRSGFKREAGYFFMAATGAGLLKYVLYSNRKYRDAAQEIAKQAASTNNPIADMFFDEIVKKANQFEEECKK